MRHIQYLMDKLHSIFHSKVVIQEDIDNFCLNHSKLFGFLFDQLDIHIVSLKDCIVLGHHKVWYINIFLKLDCRCDLMDKIRIYQKLDPKIMGLHIEHNSFRKCWIPRDNIFLVNMWTKKGQGWFHCLFVKKQSKLSKWRLKFWLKDFSSLMK